MPDPTASADPPGDAEAVASADLLHRLSARAGDELDTAELTVAGGDVVRIVDLSEVTQWLQGCAIRVRNGEPL